MAHERIALVCSAYLWGVATFVATFETRLAHKLTGKSDLPKFAFSCHILVQL